MNIRTFEPLLRDGIVKGIDSVGQKFAGAEVTTDNAVTRLLNHWNALGRAEKENVAEVVIATAVTAVSALVALKGSKKKLAKKVAKRAVKTVSRRMG